MARLTAKKLQSLKEDLSHYPMPTALDIKKAEVAAIASKDLNDFAEFLGVDLVTIKVWAKRSKAFWNAINSWETVETFNIKKNLAKRANGFTKTTSRDVITKAGLVETLRVETYYPPSETAAQFWLKNKAADEFQDKKEIDVNVNANIRAWLVAAGPMDPSETLEGAENLITDAIYSGIEDKTEENAENEMLAEVAAEVEAELVTNDDLTFNSNDASNLITNDESNLINNNNQIFNVDGTEAFNSAANKSAFDASGKAAFKW